MSHQRRCWETHGRTVCILRLAQANLAIRIGIHDAPSNFKGTTSRMKCLFDSIRLVRDQCDGPVATRGYNQLQLAVYLSLQCEYEQDPS